MSHRACKHVESIRDLEPETHVCEECAARGDTWVHLRMCMTCGHIACCDDSKNKHATAHFHSSGHPIMRSIEPDEDWMWCFVDRMVL